MSKISPPLLSDYELYESLKQQWLIKNPKASHQEFEEACKEFARRVGL